LANKCCNNNNSYFQSFIVLVWFKLNVGSCFRLLWSFRLMHISIAFVLLLSCSVVTSPNLLLLFGDVTNSHLNWTFIVVAWTTVPWIEVLILSGSSMQTKHQKHIVAELQTNVHSPYNSSNGLLCFGFSALYSISVSSSQDQVWVLIGMEN
jgi:hypothetical protein